MPGSQLVDKNVRFSGADISCPCSLVALWHPLDVFGQDLIVNVSTLVCLVLASHFQLELKGVLFCALIPLAFFCLLLFLFLILRLPREESGICSKWDQTKSVCKYLILHDGCVLIHVNFLDRHAWYIR